MVSNLHWLGHSSFRLDASRVVYFDPWKLRKGSRGADLICVSHDHFDHFSKDDIAAISSRKTVIVADRSVAGKLKSMKPACKEIRALAPGSSFDADGITVTAVPGYNIDKEFHPKESGKVGFIVTVDGMTVYHAGDTDLIPEMKSVKCDVALLPVSGTYVMTADEAAQAALAIRPKIAVPMHYGDIVGSEADAERFRDLLKGKVEVAVLKKEE